MTSQNRWFRVWCSSIGHLLVYYFKHFAITAYLLLALATFIGFVQVESLSGENKQRIIDIQVSRYESCKSTYESIRQVFKPFFPPKKHRTAKQKADLDKFNSIIDKKIAQCQAQVTPPPVPKKKGSR